MSKVVQYSNWGYWDQLDGQTLKTGEKLVVTWPDGSEQELTVEVDNRAIVIGDMGHDYHSSDCVAYGVFDWKGATIRVQLRGLEARRCP